MERYQEQRSELASICRLLYERNLVTACDGNISMRVSGEGMLLTPSGKNKARIREEDILLVTMHGDVVGHSGRPSKEFPMHRIVYERRDDVQAVIHTHPVYATAFALAGRNLPDNYLIEKRMMLRGCALTEFALPGSPEMAEVIEPYLGTCDAFLLKNHGVLTVGKGLEEAFDRMEVVESIAKTIIMSAVLGEPEVIGREDIRRFCEIT